MQAELTDDPTLSELEASMERRDKLTLLMVKAGDLQGMTMGVDASVDEYPFIFSLPADAHFGSAR